MNKFPDDLAEAFEYLDDLRASGEINMFGARPYLMRDYEYSPRDAASVLSAWMNTFDGVTPSDERAAIARAAGGAS